ncbi:N-acetyl-gamma-glutamyl-phosphate reductase [Euzebya tangerina]|uniref:N-acetyl-gamma-glutamyl-phosphate reductase n=1 Tax=Euzebya tangerina TaxID=591198 RepID=UPI000E30CA6D|nr:N-acetyl-gamma-glutamyl-phosphate reductase [Euzebya tangerina]
MNVGIVGGSGYGGAELLRLLSTHPTLKVQTVAAGSTAGQDLQEVFPSLGLEGELAPSTPEALADCQLVFLATPHAVSLELAAPLREGGAVVVDLSGAFRLPAAVFEQWYGLDHTAPQLTPATYGLPELRRDELVGAGLIAGPGCYPTATLLGLAPLAGLVEPDTVTIVGMSGSSGAGRGLREDLHVSHASGNTGAYGAPTHRHTPEIELHWAGLTGHDARVTFTPHLVPQVRGMVVTSTASLIGSAGSVRAAFEEAYATEPFVRVLPEGRWPQSTHVLGANTCHIGVVTDERTGRVTVSAAIDNLTKGAAGQAVQAANVALGLPETDGLPTMAVYP